MLTACTKTKYVTFALSKIYFKNETKKILQQCLLEVPYVVLSCKE